MSRYPDFPRPASPYPHRPNWPFVSGGADWAPQSRSLTRFGLLEADLNYRGKTWAQISIVRSFFDSVGGAGGRFTFIDFNGIGVIGGTDPGVPWSDLFVLQGTGSGTGPFDMPTYAIKASTATVSGSISAGTRTVTPSFMGKIEVGSVVPVANADGTAPELVTVTAVTRTTFTAVFANAHTSNWLVNAPIIFENGVAKTTVFGSSSPSAGTYGIVAGTGTDGVDSLYAGTSPANGVIVSCAATCRRAFRRARFIAQKIGFVYNVPENYIGDVVTVAEVRR